MGNNCSWRPSKRNIGQLLILAGSGLHAAGNAILKYLRKYKGTSFWFVIFVRGLLTIVFNLLLVLVTRGKRRVVETVLGEVRITCANASRGSGADMSYCVRGVRALIAGELSLPVPLPLAARTRRPKTASPNTKSSTGSRDCSPSMAVACLVLSGRRYLSTLSQVIPSVIHITLRITC